MKGIWLKKNKKYQIIENVNIFYYPVSKEFNTEFEVKLNLFLMN